MERAYSLLNDKSPPAERQLWIRYGKKNVTLLNKVLRNRDALTIHDKFRIQTTLAKLISLTRKFEKSGPRVSGGGDGGGIGGDASKVEWTDVETAFKSRIRTGLVSNVSHRDVGNFLDDAQKLILPRLTRTLHKYGNLKVNVILLCKFHLTKIDEIVEEEKSFNTKNEAIFPSTNIREWLEEHVKNQLLPQIEEFEGKGSGWSLIEIINLSINMNKYVPLRGGLSTYVSVPEDIKKKRAVVNIMNNDPYCFL